MLNQYLEFTDVELREVILKLLEKKGDSGYGAAALHELAEEIGLQLEPREVKFNGYIEPAKAGQVAFETLYTQSPLDVQALVIQQFGSDWGGEKVEVTIKEAE